MIRMSTGHMEGTLQLLYVLLTDCYVYLLRKGACRPLPMPPTPVSQCLGCLGVMKMHTLGVLPAVSAAPRPELGASLHEHPCHSPFQITEHRWVFWGRGQVLGNGAGEGKRGPCG